MLFYILGLLALCNAVNLRRLLAEEEVALGGGWSEGHDITDDELALWQDVTTNHADGYEAVDFASLGNPISVTTQVVAGTNYKFSFADGSIVTVYECPWENILKIDDVSVADKPAPIGAGGIGPAWTYDDSVEKPAETKDMGGWTAQVYSQEQQDRLGVDANGKPNADMNGVKSMVGTSNGGIGPEWTWNSKVEPPQGVKDMGTWKKAVYTEEQQSRLFVDEDGSPLKITDILLNRWGTGEDQTAPAMLGENGHGIGPESTWEDSKPQMLGENGHGLGPASTWEDSKPQMLGENGHGIGPESTWEDSKPQMLGQNGHGLGPASTWEDSKPQMLGENGHGLGPASTWGDSKPQMLGENGHGIGPESTWEDSKPHMLGENGHGLGPESTWEDSKPQMLGENGHGLGPESTWEDSKPSMLGEDGHGLGPEWTRDGSTPPTLGGDDHDLQPHGMLGANGHGIYHGNGLMLGSNHHGEGPKWTYDKNMEKPAGEKEMGSYTMKVYTPEQQERLGVDELGQTVGDEIVLKKTNVRKTFGSFLERSKKVFA